MFQGPSCAAELPEFDKFLGFYFLHVSRAALLPNGHSLPIEKGNELS